MENKVTTEHLSWYVIHTQPKQESRADSNLKTLGIETFTPRIKERRNNAYSGKVNYSIKAFFPSYIFARISQAQFRKVHFTRGVRSIVCFGGLPTPVDDAIIRLLKSKVAEDSCIDLEEPLWPGDKVVIENGPLQNFSGVFERQAASNQRVVILLGVVSYQAHVEIEKENLRKITV